VNHPDRHTRRSLLVLLVAVAASSVCGVSEARKVAMAAAAQLHEQFNASRCDRIYDGAGAPFKRAGPREQWNAYCMGERRRLGQWKSSKPLAGQRLESDVYLVDTGGYLVVIQNVSQFELGTARETTRFAVVDGRASLLVYLLSPDQP
jgi:hypothetical protein